VFVDSQDIAEQSVIQTDVCVIGAGAAGIVLALELMESAGVDIVILESGAAEPEDDGPSSYRVFPGRGLALGVDPSRPWYLGGNTNNWFGNCRPLEESDFEPRDWVPHSGWPIRRADVAPYYERAQAVLGLGEFGWYDLEQSRPHLSRPPLDVDPNVLDTRIIQTCPVLSVAERHRQRLELAENLRILLRVRALRLHTNAAADRATAVEVARADGGRLRVEAETFVLAAGGIENPRLLLASDNVLPNGLGNHHDLVGRCFMEHWYVDVPLGGWDGGLDLDLYQFQSDPLQLVERTRVWAQLALADDLLRRERAPGMSLYFFRSPRTSPSVLAAKRLKASMIGRAPFEPATDLRLLLTDPLEVTRHLARPSSDEGAPSDGYLLRVQLEQTPDSDNRVRLSSSRDAFGVRTPELDLRLGPDELRAYERTLAIAADELGMDSSRIVKQFRLLLGAGRCDFFWHHMGTTRMADAPEAGVVDADSRVHGVSNLFAAGSSVFTTGGIGAPTLTIVALALRLADRIKRSVPGTSAGDGRH
jgi:choline dehydrogenase-like flavoprotein